MSASEVQPTGRYAISSPQRKAFAERCAKRVFRDSEYNGGAHIIARHRPVAVRRAQLVGAQ